jgi:hypothetical protein
MIWYRTSIYGTVFVTNIIRTFLSVEAYLCDEVYLRFKVILYFREKICRYIINAVIDISYVYIYICIFLQS